MAYHVVAGDELYLQYWSSQAVALQVVWTVLSDGAYTPYTAQGTTTATRAVGFIPSSTEPVRVVRSGEVVGCHIEIQDSQNTIIKRGTTYVQSYGTAGGNIVARQFFCKGYVYSNHSVDMGEFVEATDRTSIGNHRFVTLASNVAGNVDTSTGLGVADATRIWHGLVVYYNADANAATRTVNVTIRQPYGGLPTGFATAANANIWTSATLTLTLSEEGTLYIGENGYSFASVNDTGTLTYSNNTTAPTPFPFVATDADAFSSLIIDIGSGLAGDTYSAFALVEEWLSV